jgi:hypothetical protein
MSGKRKNKEVRDAAVGAPDIADPRDEEKYERQLAFVHAWFFENIERLAGDDVKAAHSARTELQSLFLATLSQLRRLALDNKDSSAKRWAGELLASIFVSIDKHDEKLSKTNAAYLKEKKKLGKLRTHVLFATPIGKAVQRELKTAERYRKTLLLLRAGCGRKWKYAARQQIPEDYWPAIKLPEFSVKSWPQWWKFLWPLIRKNNRALLPKLRSRSSRAERVKPSDKKSGTRKINPRWSSYRQEFRNHLKTIARLRSDGVL